MGNGSNGSGKAVVLADAAVEIERRAASRYVVAELLAAAGSTGATGPWPLPPITCRITPGHDVRVVNISTVGLLVESCVPLFPGRAAAVQLTRGERRLALNGRIVRSSISAIDRDRGGATFACGIAFDRRIEAITEFAAADAENDRV
jgi:hypothetical protein